MKPKLPPDLFQHIIHLLQAHMIDDDEREAWLTQAFYLREPRLYSQINRAGAPLVFTTRCVKTLLDFGCLHDPEPEHSLSTLLKTVRYGCGLDKQAQIDRVLPTLDNLCASVDADDEPPLSSISVPLVIPTQTIATPRGERTPTVFISYSHQDETFANQLITDLNRAGHACWIDTSEIKGGDEWIMTIADGIINSYVFVPIITAKALESRWVRKEILWAIEKHKLIVPVLLENTLQDRNYFPLFDYQGVAVFESDYATVLPKLLSYLPNPTLPDVAIDERDEADAIPTTPTKPLPTAADRRKLELAYMERLQLEELLNTEKYTPMGGTAQVRQQVEMRAVFELIKAGKRAREDIQQETQRFENAVTKIQELRRCVLLGEPGGGKTTTIWKLAANAVDTALKDRSAAIPLLIRLGKWTDTDQSLPDFIASQLGDLGIHLDTLLREKRAALLLDGLNELPASQHKTKYQQVQQFIQQHPDVLAVVSCRELDYTVDLGFDKINITPLDPLRIREFAGRYLGEEKGADLFWKLAGTRAAERYQEFINEVAEKLDDPERTFWNETQLPEGVRWDWGGDNEQYKNTYWKSWLQEREKPSGLMVLARNPYMLLMLTSVYADEGQLPDNRGQLFAKFVETLLEREDIPDDEQTPLVEGLAKVAYEMQIRRAEVAGEGSNALTVLPEDDVKAILGERLLYLAGSASILNVGEQIRFTHQLLQEYFAAKYMDIEIITGRLHATDIWKPENWWERTNWEEAVILLAGLYSDNPTPVVKWLVGTQPEIAAQCIVKSGANILSDDTLLLFRTHILRLTDLQTDPDPRARAAVGRALGQLTLSNGEPLDNRLGVNVIVRDDVTLPDIDWAEIPTGGFIYQKDEKRHLDTFYISRYPLTYIQFQTFIDDPEGFYDPRWWEGLSLPHGHNSAPGDQAYKFSNHPRERVSWYDAIAFCRWLSWRLGGGYDLNHITDWAVRLPTEFEWEKAARGTDGRKYPYGNDFDVAGGNTRETGIGQTSAVGAFPDGASPYGLLDMSGNVWEWCLTEYKNPEPDVTDVNIRSNELRGVRGGSWSSTQGRARAVVRSRSDPDGRFSNYGFRLVRPHS